VSVLKDRAATSSYGSRGAAGVIILSANAKKEATADSGGGKITVTGYRTTGEQPVTVQTDDKKGKTELTADTVTLRLKNEEFGYALIMIDGEERDSTALNAVPPNRIEAIYVWKGDQAKEKFGKKGANGVVEVTTKN